MTRRVWGTNKQNKYIIEKMRNMTREDVSEEDAIPSYRLLCSVVSEEWCKFPDGTPLLKRKEEKRRKRG